MCHIPQTSTPLALPPSGVRACQSGRERLRLRVRSLARASCSGPCCSWWCSWVLFGGDCRDDDQLSAATWAWKCEDAAVRIASFDRVIANLATNRCFGPEKLSDIGGTVGISEEAAVADAALALWQDMDQEPADELVGPEGHGLVPAGVVKAAILDAEGDALVVHADQAAVGDRDTNSRGRRSTRCRPQTGRLPARSRGHAARPPQQIVELPLVLMGDAGDRLWQREDQMEISHGQQFGLTCRQPGLCRIHLAFGPAWHSGQCLLQQEL